MSHATIDDMLDSIRELGEFEQCGKKGDPWHMRPAEVECLNRDFAVGNTETQPVATEYSVVV